MIAQFNITATATALIAGLMTVALQPLPVSADPGFVLIEQFGDHSTINAFDGSFAGQLSARSYGDHQDHVWDLDGDHTSLMADSRGAFQRSTISVDGLGSGAALIQRKAGNSATIHADGGALVGVEQLSFGGDVQVSADGYSLVHVQQGH